MEKSFKNIVLEILPYVIVILIAIIVKVYIVSPIRVNGESMDNTLRDGDYMILNKISYRFEKIKRFEIVVAKYSDEHIIKRVIGLPGETVEYKDNELFINGKKIKYSYKAGKTENFTKKLKKDEYFLMGDNRENSMDSRVLGPFSKKKIEGKTHFIVLPFSRFGSVK